MIEETPHIFQGMSRGNHQIKQKSSILWDALNIRLTNRENDTLLSITNEKGTSGPLLNFNGSYVGHCVLGKYLVVFTSSSFSDTIYRINKNEDGTYTQIDLFSGKLGLNKKCPIETLGIYETEFVQKVYWIDEINSPRVINITKPELKIPKEDQSTILVNGADLTHYRDAQGRLLYDNNSFDFISTLSLNEEVRVNRVNSVGMFSPGTIQYAFTYYNKYGSESNIVYTTPLHYISPNGRGGNPEEKVSCGFDITVNGLDSFEYLRIYSIHRTSIDAVPTVKLVTDLPITSDNIHYLDRGTEGETVDPTYLLYVGGKDIIAKTFTQKDNTLFFGNIKLKDTTKTFKDIMNVEGSFVWGDGIISLQETELGQSYYKYDDSLDKKYSAIFKTNEIYRCGIQFQDSHGIWSEPIFLADTILNDKYPTYNVNTKSIVLSNPNILQSLIDKGARKVRTCVVFPRTFERNVICQGVLCPTVYSVSGRSSNTPYAAASWFFRPAVNFTKENIYNGANIEFRHNKALVGISNRNIEISSNRGIEIQSMSEKLITDANNAVKGTHDSYFFVDENLVTFNSPDIEFDTNLQNLNWENTRLRIIGKAMLGTISGDIDIQTSSPVFDDKAIGFNKQQIGYNNLIEDKNNGGLVSGFFYQDSIVNLNNYTVAGNVPINFMIYPWNKSGSLNNDTNRPVDKGTKSAVLKTKKMSNLKFFSDNKFLDTSKEYKISTPELFMSDQMSLIKVGIPFLKEKVPYYGNVDTLITQKDYPIIIGEAVSDVGRFLKAKEANSSYGGQATDIYKISEPIRMSYKSTPHLVFSLGEEGSSTINLIPRIGNTEAMNNSDVTLPTWWFNTNNTSSDTGLYDGVLKYFGLQDIYEPPSYIAPDTQLFKEPTYSIVGPIEGKYLLYRYRVYNAGLFVEADLVNIPNSCILKVASDKCQIWHYQYLPNTTANDYNDQYYYTGKTRYYKITRAGNLHPSSLSPTPVYTIADVTTDIETQITNKTDTFTIKQHQLNALSDETTSPYLLLAELIRDVPNKFGGESEEALRTNMWFPASDPVRLPESMSPEEGYSIVVPYQYGDTWYQRYDCLKTYPFTEENENQIVEIGSFMCETRVNIDGRYDKNRGQYSNLNMSPRNFNLFNEVYSQKDNFFNYRILEEELHKQNTFANQILWSKEKSLGEEIDTWTNINLASTYDLDGDKGKITALETFNNTLLCFQDKALSEILFNSRVQIPTSDGVPIEISNNYKLSGTKIISSKIGCQSKWTIGNSSQGIYFIDYNTASIWLYNDKLQDIASTLGMSWWIKNNTWDTGWIPSYKEINGIRTVVDFINGDIYFVSGMAKINNKALCYSEKLSSFVSFFDYGGVPAMFNFDDGFYSINSIGQTKLYQNNVGEYNYIYGSLKEWYFSFISNDNPTSTKIFDSFETRADCYNKEGLLNECPFNYIKVENEYQKGMTSVNNINTKKKFRVWRGFIPRNTGTMQRIRNPWAMITLGRTPINSNVEDNNIRAEIHDIAVKYSI